MQSKIAQMNENFYNYSHNLSCDESDKVNKIIFYCVLNCFHIIILSRYIRNTFVEFHLFSQVEEVKMQFYFLVLLLVAVANCAIPKNYVEIGHYGINYGTRKTYYYSGTLQVRM